MRALNNHGLLYKFYTTIAVYPGGFLFSLSKLPFLKDLKRRFYEPKLRKYTAIAPFKEFTRLIASKLKLGFLVRHERGLFSVDAIYRNLDTIIARELDDLKVNGVNAIYSFEDGSLACFKKAKSLDIFCFYDLPIGYWKAQRILLNEEKKLNPEWFKTIAGFKDSDCKLKRKDEELRLADCILVASTFTANTLKHYKGHLKSVKVVPFGFPEVVERREYESVENRKLKVLYVGSLSQRKGISYLFDAVNQLSDFLELTLVGRRAVSDCKVLNEELKKHIWFESLPNDEVLELMRKQDLFIFPSLFEGFGLVITEAMSQGTPVITTERTCGPDIIKHGENGWIVKAGSTEDLLYQLQDIIQKPELIEQVGKAARETAKARPWQVYEQQVIKTLVDVYSNQMK